MVEERIVKLFRNGRTQAVRIPKEFEFPGEEVLIRKDGHRLIVEPISSSYVLKLIEKGKPARRQAEEIDDQTPRPAKS